jgi:hypothetical protein
MAERGGRYAVVKAWMDDDGPIREASIKLRNFKARYLTMKLTIREYSNLGKFAHLNSTKSK